jgi:acylglycerol lipase
MIEHELSPISSHDGLKLFITTNEVDDPTAALILIHGFGEHIGRYEHVYQACADQNILVYGMDLRGHGKSEGKRGHARSYELLLSDIEELLKTFRSDYNDLPTFLYGHSMGGNLVANFAISKPLNELKGFILSSPWLKLAFEPPAWQTSAAKILSKVIPGFSMDDNLDANELSKIPEVAHQYVNDPLVNSKISAGLYMAITEAGQHALNHHESIKIPGFVYHGDADKITNHAASKEFAANHQNISWKSYENVRHEGHNDTEQEAIIANVINWVKDNC